MRTEGSHRLEGINARLLARALARREAPFLFRGCLVANAANNLTFRCLRSPTSADAARQPQRAPPASLDKRRLGTPLLGC